MEKYQERLNDRDRATEIIAQNTSVNWRGEPTWNGITPEDLINLTQEIARIIGFKPEYASKINVVFGDHHGFSQPLIFSHLHPAFCTGIRRSDNDRYFHCEVVINRSRELAIHTLEDTSTSWEEKSEAEFFSRAGILDTTSPQEQIKCRFETVLEYVTWMITEELKHAQIMFIAGSERTMSRWQRKYTEMLFNHGISHDRVYAVKLEEVAVSRIAVQVLKSLSQSEDRKKYFRMLYERSLAQTRHVAPVVNRDFFVPTGYNPSSLRQIVFRVLCI